MLTTDTTTLLEGTWDVTGYTIGFIFEPATNFVPLLPNSDVDMIIKRTDSLVSFGTNGIGSPDNPFFQLDHTSGFSGLEFFGEYNNNASNTLIQFAFTNISDTGGVDGTFTGDFCLSANLDNCDTVTPVSTPATFALILLSLAGIGAASRRRKI